MGQLLVNSSRSVVSLLLVFLISRPLLLDAQQADTILREGTPVRLAISRAVSSADAKKGDNVDFTTLDDISGQDTVIIPKGSIAMGIVTEAVPHRRLARGGKLDLKISYLQLPSGARLPLRGVKDLKGGSRTDLMVVGMAASVLFFPAAPLFLLIKGKDISIAKGQELTVYTDADYESKTGRIGSGAYLTNADVVKLKEAGLSDEIIIGKIKSAPANFQLDADGLAALKRAGLSDAVIAAMLKGALRTATFQ